MGYKCKHFIIEELVDPDTFKDLGEDTCWGLFDEAALKLIDDIRGYFKRPMRINNWHTGGTFKYRGYRPSTCTVGAPKSGHRQGYCFDFDVIGLTAASVRTNLILNRDILFKSLTELEMTLNKKPIGWVHASTRPTNQKAIKLLHC